MRLAVVVSHPIQHFCPQYSSWSALPWCDLRVIFGTKVGMEPYVDPGFEKVVCWEGLQLDFDHVFLTEQTNTWELDAQQVKRVSKELERFKPDAVLIYGYRDRLSRAGLAWARNAKVKKLMFSDAENHSQRSLWKKLIKTLPVRLFLSKLDGILTTGDANESYYRTYGCKDTIFYRCPYPIDRDRIDIVSQERKLHRQEVRLTYQIPADTIVLCCIGKLVDKKRQKDVIESVRILESTFPGLTVILIGSGKNRGSLEVDSHTLRSGRVIFTDFVQPRRMFEILCATDIYVHASSLEPHSVAVSEAVYLGCPVVISDRCGSYGPTDDVQNGRNGLLYRCTDPFDLARQISRLAGDTKLRSLFSVNSRRHGVQAQELSHGAGLHAALVSLGLADPLGDQINVK